MSLLAIRFSTPSARADIISSASSAYCVGFLIKVNSFILILLKMIICVAGYY
jgi:hypothetical protein